MDYTTYTELDGKVDELVAAEEYPEALELLKVARQVFPGHLWEILQYEGSILIRQEEYERCLDTIEEGVTNGLFFGIESWDIFDPFRHTARYQAIEEADRRLKAEAQRKAEMAYEVHTPDGYTPARKYPLFITLHGNGNSMAFFRTHWWKPAAALSAGFVVLYVQSSQAECTNGFGWTADYRTTREDIKAAYDEVVQQYAIDTDDVLVGGFSGGAVASIEITLADTLPARGFVALCPGFKPDSFTRANAVHATRRGVKGVLMKGELEGDIPEQEEMLAVLQEAGFPHRFQVYPGMGHAYPEDFAQEVLNAIAFIRSG